MNAPFSLFYYTRAPVHKKSPRPAMGRRLLLTTVLKPCLGYLHFRYPHLVEGTPHEDEPDNKQRNSDKGSIVRGACFLGVYRHFNGDFRCQQAEQGRELDDRVQGNGGRILEGIAHGIADDGRGMKRCPFPSDRLRPPSWHCPRRRRRWPCRWPGTGRSTAMEIR